LSIFLFSKAKQALVFSLQNILFSSYILKEHIKLVDYNYLNSKQKHSHEKSRSIIHMRPLL